VPLLVHLKVDSPTLLEFLVFQTGNFGQKYQIGGGGGAYHFGQVDFNMSNVTGVVFFTNRLRTI